MYQPSVPVKLDRFDHILINSSGGKDSQSMLHVIWAAAVKQGVQDRVTVVHADLGRVEWDGTAELAAAQAAHYGARFEVVRREQGDLLHQIEHQRGKFPGYGPRFCTSDHKRAPVRRLMTRLCRETEAADPSVGRKGRRTRILNCMGHRAQESRNRAKLAPLMKSDATNATVREVIDWHPILHWTEEQVWSVVRASGVPHHPAYDLGMPRLSCSFCVLASQPALVRAAQLRPELAAEYAAIEERIGHDFKHKLPMRDIIAIAAESDVPAVIDGWAA